jgi:hypothetical protein
MNAGITLDGLRAALRIYTDYLDPNGTLRLAHDADTVFDERIATTKLPAIIGNRPLEAASDIVATLAASIVLIGLSDCMTQRSSEAIGTLLADGGQIRSVVGLFGNGPATPKNGSQMTHAPDGQPVTLTTKSRGDATALYRSRQARLIDHAVTTAVSCLKGLISRHDSITRDGFTADPRWVIVAPVTSDSRHHAKAILKLAREQEQVLVAINAGPALLRAVWLLSSGYSEATGQPITDPLNLRIVLAFDRHARRDPLIGASRPHCIHVVSRQEMPDLLCLDHTIIEALDVEALIGRRHAEHTRLDERVARDRMIRRPGVWARLLLRLGIR